MQTSKERAQQLNGLIAECTQDQVEWTTYLFNSLSTQGRIYVADVLRQRVKEEIEASQWREIEIMGKMKSLIEQRERGLIDSKESVNQILRIIDDYCREKT